MAFFLANTSNTMRLKGRSFGVGQPQLWIFEIFGQSLVEQSVSVAAHRSRSYVAHEDPEPVATSKLAEREQAIKNGLRRAAHKLGLITDGDMNDDDHVFSVSDDDTVGDVDNAAAVAGISAPRTSVDAIAMRGYTFVHAAPICPTSYLTHYVIATQVDQGIVYDDDRREMLATIMANFTNVSFTAETRGDSLPQKWQYALFGELGWHELFAAAMTDLDDSPQ